MRRDDSDIYVYSPESSDDGIDWPTIAAKIVIVALIIGALWLWLKP